MSRRLPLATDADRGSGLWLDVELDRAREPALPVLALGEATASGELMRLVADGLAALRASGLAPPGVLLVEDPTTPGVHGACAWPSGVDIERATGARGDLVVECDRALMRLRGAGWAVVAGNAFVAAYRPRLTVLLGATAPRAAWSASARVLADRFDLAVGAVRPALAAELFTRFAELYRSR